MRPDVVIVDPYDATFDPSLAPYWRGEESLLPRFRAEGRRVFVVSDHPGYVPKWVRRHGRLERFGIVYEVFAAGAVADAPSLLRRSPPSVLAGEGRKPLGRRREETP